jgi:hypothetical protein
MALAFGKPMHGFHDRKKAVTVRSVTGPDGFSAFIYKCVLNVDWDGAPNCYGLDRPGFPEQTGLDPWESKKHHGSLSNGRTNADWGKEWCAVFNTTKSGAIHILRQYGLIPPKPAKGPDVLSEDSRKLLERFWDNRTHTAYGHSLENKAGDGSFPIVQIEEAPTTLKKGYYVSTTGLRDTSKDRWDPNSYIDASTVPYSVLPALSHVAMGDYGLVIRNKTGDCTPYVCADSSGAKHGSHKLGECSGAVYLAVGEENEGDFSFIVFPQSGSGVMNDTAAAERVVRARFSKLSSGDANNLASQLATHAPDWGNVRTALTQKGAPGLVVDAVTGA